MKSTDPVSSMIIRRYESGLIDMSYYRGEAERLRAEAAREMVIRIARRVRGSLGNLRSAVRVGKPCLGC